MKQQMAASKVKQIKYGYIVFQGCFVLFFFEL